MADMGLNAGVRTTHPQYTIARAAEWRLMRDAMAGESAMKAAREAYLPMPDGFRMLPDKGAKAYAAYQMRASFPEVLAPSISALVGIAHGKEIKIKLPDAMNAIWENADGEGMPLEAFHRRITRELLGMGRYGVLADAPEGGGDPYLTGYAAETIINWDTGFYVLDETEPVRSGFQWDLVNKWRVLSLEDGAYQQTLYRDGYEVGEAIAPTGRGGRRLDHVPFAVASAVDIKPDIRTPPLIGVARAALAIYQLDADQRHQLFMSGQETLVIVNGEAPDAVGAGAVIVLQSGEGTTADAKYVSPTCSGIDAHADKISDKRTEAVMAGARLLEQSDSVQESGEARKLRFASETATLQSVLQQSCGLLEASLRNAAELIGLPTADIVVTPPVDLLDNTMTAQDFAALFGVYEAGGMSWDTYYENGQRGGIFSPERDADEEFKLLDGQGDDDAALVAPNRSMTETQNEDTADGAENRS